MVGSSTIAVIFGSDSFVAEKLENRLVEQGIKVVHGDYEEIPVNTVYFFDFVGNEAAWERLDKNQRLVAVQVNSDDDINRWENTLRRSGLNWRIVVGENVYGEGMDETTFMGRAFEQAARNRNLVLPSIMQLYRLLAVDDLVEAILRSCFFSGTSGKILIVGGKEINSKIVAEVLIEEAKMTKVQVIQDEKEVLGMDPNYIKETSEILRWEPEVTFTEGARPVVQYFVAKADTEDRKKPIKKNIQVIKPQIQREAVERRYQVEIEEEADEKEVVIEPDKIETVTPEPILAKEYDKVKDEFKVEKFNKSPLPERKVIKREEDSEEEFYVPPSSKFKLLDGSWTGWSKEIDSVEENSETSDGLPTTPPDREENKKEVVPEEKKRKKFNFKFKIPGGWWWMFWGMMGIFLTIFFINIIKIISIPKKIEAVKIMIENGKYTEATKEIEMMSKNNRKMLDIFGSGTVGVILRAEGEVIGLLDSSLNLSQSGEKIGEGLFGDKDIGMKVELQKVETNLDGAISKMGILQGRLSGQWKSIPGRFREELIKLRDQIAVERNTAEDIRKILPILPELLGLDGKRREYMVLLQNENELRPSGGFIGSYAIMGFEGGKFLGFEVKDVYEADG
ncbi:MAG: DUF4012 domain-containing protein, partial [Candidatus Shapirobacteria bacterium]